MRGEQKNCPVCQSVCEPYFLYEKQERYFLYCPGCRLIFQENPPGEEEEKQRYSLHRNSEKDPGYVHWLERFIGRGILPWYEEGPLLDFGSGPEPLLSELLREKGLHVVSYDKFYASEWPAGRIFPFVILSEVLEHLRDPVGEFKRIYSLTSDDARLVLQSSFVRDFRSEWFASWWYKEDITHIRFFSASSLNALGRASGWDLQYQDGKSIAVFKKRGIVL